MLLIALLIPKHVLVNMKLRQSLKSERREEVFFQVIEPLFYSSRIIGGVVYNIIFSSCKKEEMMLDHY